MSILSIVNGDRVWRNEVEQLHREDGPAFEETNGDKEWWIHSQQYTETHFNSIVEQERL